MKPICNISVGPVEGVFAAPAVFLDGLSEGEGRVGWEGGGGRGGEGDYNNKHKDPPLNFNPTLNSES